MEGQHKPKVGGRKEGGKRKGKKVLRKDKPERSPRAALEGKPFGCLWDLWGDGPGLSPGDERRMETLPMGEQRKRGSERARDDGHQDGKKWTNERTSERTACKGEQGTSSSSSSSSKKQSSKQQAQTI